MSTDKIPNIAPSLDEWCAALRWHPDLTHDLRAATAMIDSERKHKRLRRQASILWRSHWQTQRPYKPPPPIPDDTLLPVLFAKAWLRRRYAALWNQAPHMPRHLTLDKALWIAAEAGSWEQAATVIRADFEHYASRRHVRADTFTNVQDVRVPNWVHDLESEPMLQLLSIATEKPIVAAPSILLTIRDYATLDDAKRALEIAWPTIEGEIPPQPGARADKSPHRGAPNFTQQVILYHLFRAWTRQRQQRGEKATQTEFAKALSAGSLPLQQPRAAHLLRATSTVPDETIAWLTKDYPQSQEYVGKRLRDILPVFAPDKKTQRVTEYLSSFIVDKSRDAT